MRTQKRQNKLQYAETKKAKTKELENYSEKSRDINDQIKH